ncbi:MAG: nuclear transport factor 2 family protein [Gammaproteobacteria bacterium]
MNKEITMPPPVATFIRAVNDHDADAFLSTFTKDAVVTDVGREFRGLAAIKEWSDREIFDVNVILDVVVVAECDGHTVVTFKVDGTFDTTGLPDPLLLEHHFTLKGGKIAAFKSRLAGEEPGV